MCIFLLNHQEIFHSFKSITICFENFNSKILLDDFEDRGWVNNVVFLRINANIIAFLFELSESINLSDLKGLLHSI